MKLQTVAQGLLILAVSASAAAAPLPGDPSPANASAPSGASPPGNVAGQSNASTRGKLRPTPAQLDQPGSVAVASPNERNTGTTFASPDPSFFGRLNLQALTKPLEQPPALQVAPGDAAKSGGTGNTAAPAQAPN